MKDSKRSLILKAENNTRVRGMIGFARRAGKCIIGTELICRALPKGEVKLVVVSATASAPTKKKLTVKCDYYKVDHVESEIDTDGLGSLVGKSGAVAAVAITDSQFADQIIKAVVGE